MTAPLWGLVFALGSALLLWLWSLRLRDSGIAEIFWGPGIAGVVDIAAFLGHAAGARAGAALFLVNLWALRLAVHLYSRRRGEDRRHAALRQQFGQRWRWGSLVYVFLLQAILIWFVPAPLVAAMLPSRAGIGPLAGLGIGLAAAGLLIETLADTQLAAFRTDPNNARQVLDRGLWAWSRHPNYFGEALLWWGFFLIGYSASGAWWLILSPLLVTALLLQIKGIPWLEAGITQRRPAYADYQRRVSSFLPLPPRRPG